MPDIFQIGVDLADLAKTVASAEDRIKLAEVAMALNQLATENKQLIEENSELRKALARRKSLEYRDDSYYLTTEEGEQIGPVCPKCYQGDALINRLERANGGARCSVCGTRYAGSRYAVEGYHQRVG